MSGERCHEAFMTGYQTMTAETRHEADTLRAPDGHEIHVQAWAPAGDATAVIQVLHGMGEHSGRYARFAAAACARGYAVCAHDHRGHGPQASTPRHFADRGGWQAVIDDARLVCEYAGDRHPGRPLVLLGHSMGSFIAEAYAMRYGDGLHGLLLSGSTWPAQAQVIPARLLARLIAWRRGLRGHSPLLDRLGFADFNKAFRPARTDFDWLSRDEAEVDKYVADPLCGGPYSCGLWLDLLGGLREIGRDAALLGIPAALPILITGGAADPVGGDRAMTKLAMHFAQTGHGRLAVKIYPEGRHEMLNETCRDAVTRDWLDWIGTTMRSVRRG
jgi:alpha-beta hydrolase superfamily lysophospholipase